MLELTLIHVSKKGLDCIKIGKVWSIRVICIRRFGNLSSRLHMSNSGTRTLFDWKCGVSVFHSCNIRIVWGLWSQSNFHDMIISIINIFWLHWIINRLVVMHPYALSHNKAVLNYVNHVYGVATICHQVRCLRWGHPSLFHTVTSLLIWYNIFCMRDTSYRLIWIKFINMLSVYAQSGAHGRFKWLIIAVLT